jgi:hypothetical protein
VIGWFREEGFGDVALTNAQYGGAVNCIGTAPLQ